MLNPSLLLMTLLLSLTGLAIGLLVTVFGGGGGFFYVPILVLLFHIPAQIAIATSLAATIPTVVVGSIGHYRKGNIDLRIGLLFGFSGLFGALIGAYSSHLMSASILQKGFGVYSIILTIPMILTSRNRLEKAGASKKEPKPLDAYRVVLSCFFGALSGIMAGLFGTSGTASIVAGLYILGLPVSTIVGTSVLVVLFNSISGFLGHVFSAGLDWPLIFSLSAGSVIGAFLGPPILARIDVKALEKVYGIAFILLVLILGVIMLIK